MSNERTDYNNGSELTDEKMDFLIKEAVRLELERKKILGFDHKPAEDSKLVNVYA